MKKIIIATIIAFSAVSAKCQWVKTFSNTNDVRRFAVDGTNIYSVIGNATIKSADSGKSWNYVVTPFGSVLYTIAANGPNMFLGSEYGILKSINSGANWFGVAVDGKPVTSLAINGSTIFAGSNNTMFVSTNDGYNWLKVNNGLYNSEILTLAIMGNNVFAGTRDYGIFLTNNNGLSWKDVNNGFTPRSISTIVVDGTNVYAGSWNGGVYFSADTGKSWKNIGLNSTVIYSLAISGKAIFAGTSGSSLLLTTDQGTTWKRVKGLGDFTMHIAACGNSVVASWNNYGVYTRSISESIKSTDINDLSMTNSNMFIYPSPAHEKIIINSGLMIKNITLRNILGELVYSNMAIIEQQTNEIDVSNLPKGIYVITAETTDGPYNRKIILQ